MNLFAELSGNVHFPDLFYGGETFSLEQQLSYTCPLCGRLGFTDVLLQEHVGMDHPDASLEVVNCRQNQMTSNICDLKAVLMIVNYCL